MEEPVLYHRYVPLPLHLHPNKYLITEERKHVGYFTNSSSSESPRVLENVFFFFGFRIFDHNLEHFGEVLA